MQKKHKKTNVKKETKKFLNDTLDFFTKRLSGHMGIWRYSEPLHANDPVRGMEHWANFVTQAKNGSAYYCYQEEVAVIQQAISSVKNHIQDAANLIDLGPGSEDAIKAKPGMFIGNIPQITSYTAVDIAEKTIGNYKSVITKLYPHLNFNGLHADFYEDELDLVTTQQSVFVFFGQTMFNVPVDPFDKASLVKIIVKRLEQLKKNLKKPNDVLIITQDTTQDKDRIESAYEPEAYFNLNLLERIKRDLPVSENFNPENFSFRPEFIKETGALSHTYISKKDQEFYIDDTRIQLKKDQQLFMHNTYKISASDFIDYARQAGLQCVDTVMNTEKTAALHIFKAIDKDFGDWIKKPNN